MSKRIGLFRQLDTYHSEERHKQLAKDVEDYLKFYTPFAGIIVETHPFPYNGKVTPHPVPYMSEFQHKDALLDYCQANELGKFDNYLTVGGTAGYCGQAYRGLGWAVTYLTYGCSKLKTTIHELYHSDPEWALGHAGGHEDSEYGGLLNMMGTVTTNVHGLHGPHLFMLGLNRGIEITDSAEEVKLAPAEMSPHALADDEYNIMMIEDLMFSHRKVKGHPYALPSTYEGRVFVHKVDLKKRRTNRYDIDLESIGDRLRYGKYTITYKFFDKENEQAVLEVTKEDEG